MRLLAELRMAFELNATLASLLRTETAGYSPEFSNDAAGKGAPRAVTFAGAGCDNNDVHVRFFWHCGAL